MFLVDLAYVLMIIVFIVNIRKAKENLPTTFLGITIYINCYHDMTCNQILYLLIREVWIKDAKQENLECCLLLMMYTVTLAPYIMKKKYT